MYFEQQGSTFCFLEYEGVFAPSRVIMIRPENRAYQLNRYGKPIPLKFFMARKLSFGKMKILN